MKRIIEKVETKKILALLIGCSFMTKPLSADEGLPYIGVKSKSCKVMSVKTSLDGGFQTDENCKVLYVHPPKLGEARITAASPTSNLNKCEHINMVNMIQLDNLNRIEAYTKKKFALRAKLDEAQARGDRLQVIEILAEIKASDEMLKAFNESAASQDEVVDEANSRTGGPVMITLMYHWAELVEDYRKINPQFKSVKRLPITKGYLTHQMKRGTGSIPSLGEDPVIKIHSTGLPVVDSKVTDEGDDNLNIVTSSADTRDSTESLMEGTKNIGLELSLLGLCPYVSGKGDRISIGSVTNSPVAYLTPNFTYFYPVTSKSIYKVSINPSSLGDAVIKLRKKGLGHVHSIDLANILGNSETSIFTEISTTDLNGGDGVSEKQKTEVKKTLLDYIANSVLRSIGTMISKLENASSYRTHWTETRRGRKSCGFLGMSRCNYSYKVHHSEPNWEKIARTIEKQLNTNRSASSESQKTYQLPGTMAFVPPEELPRIELEYQQRRAQAEITSLEKQGASNGDK